LIHHFGLKKFVLNFHFRINRGSNFRLKYHKPSSEEVDIETTFPE